MGASFPGGPGMTAAGSSLSTVTVHRTVYLWITSFHNANLKGNGVATLAQNKIFPAKQELLLSEITGLPLDVQMQRNRLGVDERVEGSRQCSCSRPS
jgi:hypothetical protein